MVRLKSNESLAQALTIAKRAAKENVIKYSNLESKQIGLLKRAGCLTSIIRGWYILNKPEAAGTSTVWYAGFWSFIKYYLIERFGKQGYCLSADSSLGLHLEESHVVRQVTAITLKASNTNIDMPHDTSLFLYADSKNYPKQITRKNGVNVMTLPLALCRLPLSYFKENPLKVEIALKMLPSVSEVSRILLEGGSVSSAGRIAGALRAIGETKKADQVISDMKAADYKINEFNPFEQYQPVLSGLSRVVSPIVGRIQAMWKRMRGDVIDIFPEPPGIVASEEKKYIKVIMDLYKEDAYHSLSIEGYEVTEELIQKIASGEWAPDKDPKDLDQRNTMAVRGYYNSFQLVTESVRKVIKGEQPGEIFEDDLQAWYRELFSPSVQSGMLSASDLAGYRRDPVYITGSRHVPPNRDAVSDAMETLFGLLKEEKHPAVRAVLGHFIFVYIHPYMDGNGRVARFLLNLMLISGGYNWTVIRINGREKYMSALEAASTKGEIKLFVEFIRSELEYWTKK